ncbi:ribose 5-phosphate isomerase B [Pseudolactococcus laudensis]|uniref:ribose 5-phosphate isomerase B n=1 Tax=Pseudolactococcus laudensis TaxID=1494461 RepID=UPI002FC6556C
MKIAIGNDHGGVQLKQALKTHLIAKGYEVLDLGTNSVASTDYPIYGQKVSEAVINQAADLGIALCGTGIGISIACNKVKGIRAALCHDVFSAQATREHNDSNVLCMGARVIGDGLACMIVDTWLDAIYQGGRYAQRVALLEKG